MSPQFRTLIMKDWTERRRLLGLGLGALLFYVGYCVAYQIEFRTRTFVASHHSSLEGFGLIAALLLSMSTATGEYSHRTLKFSASLPISLFQIAWSRLLVMWAYMIVPMILSTLIASVLLGSGLIEQAALRAPDYIDSQNRVDLLHRPNMAAGEAVGLLWTTTVIAICSAMYLSTWISVAGTFCRREGTAGFLGAILILLSTAFGSVRSDLERGGYFFFSDWISSVLPTAMIINWGYGQMDGSSYTDIDVAPLITGPLTINLLLTLSLGCLFAWRYGRRSEVTRDASLSRWKWPHLPRLLSHLPIRLPGRIGALVWLDLRQSVPLCFSGLVIAALLTLIGLRSSQVFVTVESRFVKQLPENTWFLGMLFAMIVAVGVFGAETKSGLDEFWRSRPIEPRTWFWTKFIVGLSALVAILDFFPALGLYSLRGQHDPNSGYVSMGIWASLFCLPLMHAQIYAFTVAAIGLLRRPIQAAILGLMLWMISDSLFEAVPVYPKLSTMNVLNALNRAEETEQPLNLVKSGYPLIYGIVVLLLVIATILAKRSLIPTTLRRITTTGMLLVGMNATLLAQEQDQPVEKPVLKNESPLVSEVLLGMEKREKKIQEL